MKSRRAETGDLGAPIKERVELYWAEKQRRENEHSREEENLEVSCEGTMGNILDYTTLCGWETRG